MCTNPFHIRPKHGNRDNNGLLGYDVPCGKCPECLRQKRNDYFIRSLHEYKKCGDFGLFVTLTFNDSNLNRIESLENMPIFHNWDNIFGTEWLEEPLIRVFSVFNKKQVQNFFKKLNEKIHYYLGSVILGLTRLKKDCKRRKTDEWRDFERKYKRCIRYLVVCERGGNQTYTDSHGVVKTATSRPHYHAMIFLTYPELRTPNAIRKIKSFIRELWSYGFVKSLNISNKGKEMRSPEKAICYICKYVTKDTTNYMYSHPDDTKNFSPFILLSKFFGDGKVTSDNFLHLYQNGISTPLSTLPLNMPRYYYDKFTRNHSIIPYKHLSTLKPKTRLYFGKSVYFIDDYLNPIIDNLSISFLTPLGKDIYSFNRVKKAQYYAESLRNMKNTSNLSALYKYGKLANRDYNQDLILIDSVGLNKFYTYILDYLYITDNFNGVDTSNIDNENKYLFELFKLVRDYNHTLTILKRNANELKYKNNLRKAMEQKPELFTDNNFL